MSIRSGSHRAVVRLCVISAALFATVMYAPQGVFADVRSQAEEHFLNNEPEDAIELFEEYLESEPGDSVAYKQLSAAYEQIGDYDSAFRVLERAIENSDGPRYEFLYNKGNLAARQGDWDQALEYFSDAADSNSEFAQPRRNRANIHVQSGEYEKAVSDYEEYISLREDSPQRSDVEDMIAALNDRIAEEQRRIEEEERRAEERERREAEAQERREALRDTVRQRLEDQRSGTDRSTGGEEDFEGIEDDLDVLD